MTRVLRFAGGGSLDGLAWKPPRLPDPVELVVTTERDEGQSHYVLDDTAGTAYFVGLNKQGEAMGRIIRALSAAARDEARAIAEALMPRSCTACGLTFGSQSAYTVAHDRGGCLPAGAYGQLVEVDGCWCIRGSDAAAR